ncbi:MAG TPA: TonB family protein [Flavisolibacter sp.]|nr:TonB family protein [Flavisolibacter sp.]
MKCFLLLLMCLPLRNMAQKKDTLYKYLDADLQPTDEKNGEFFGVAIKKDGYWVLYAIYPDTTPVIKAIFKDRQLKIKHGPYTVYYPKNRIETTGFYHNNMMNGVWQTWYPNGNKKDSGLVINNQLVNLWKEWYPNGHIKNECTYSEAQDQTIYKSINTPWTGPRNGKYSSWYENGKMESLGKYINGIMDGEWKWYYDNGNISTIEFYSDGKISALQCFDTTGKSTGEYCSISKPPLLKPAGDFREYIFGNLLWPEEAIKNKIEGTVDVNFTVTKNGELKDLKITSDKAVLKKEVERLFETMKEWYPAVSHNRPVDAQEEFSIPFYRKK